MEVEKILYSNHAIKQMFQRNISVTDVDFVLKNGINLVNYHDDKPFPSRLMLAFVNNRPLHVVCSLNEKDNITIIITVYEPSVLLWEKDFKTRKI